MAGSGGAGGGSCRSAAWPGPAAEQHAAELCHVNACSHTRSPTLLAGQFSHPGVPTPATGRPPRAPRERSDASGFTTGLDEYRKYLLRRAEAERMRQEHEEKEAARAAGGAAGGDGDGAPARDHLALKQNITIPLKAVGSRVGRPWPRTPGAPGTRCTAPHPGRGSWGAALGMLSRCQEAAPSLLHPSLAVPQRSIDGQRIIAVVCCPTLPHPAIQPTHSRAPAPHYDTHSSTTPAGAASPHPPNSSTTNACGHCDAMRPSRTAHGKGRQGMAAAPTPHVCPLSRAAEGS